MSRNNGAAGRSIRYGPVLSLTAPSHRGAAAPLLELAPALATRLAEDERRVAMRLQIPVRTAFGGPFDLDEVLHASGAFSLLIIDGVLVAAVSLGGHCGLRLFGPGDLLGPAADAPSDLFTQSELRASGAVRYAALDDRVLGLAQRYPRLIEGLQMQAVDQQQRLVAQLLICQLPRVQDRVLALMWLLAETWGRVTPSGTVLPMRLTHDTIGLLVGARRSTVTLALGHLERRGALVRRADDWLILERLGRDGLAPAEDAAPRLTGTSSPDRWRAPASTPSEDGRFDRLNARRADAVRQSRAAVAGSERVSRRSRQLIERVARRRSAGRDGLHQQDHAGDLLALLGGVRVPER